MSEPPRRERKPAAERAMARKQRRERAARPAAERAASERKSQDRKVREPNEPERPATDRGTRAHRPQPRSPRRTEARTEAPAERGSVRTAEQSRQRARERLAHQPPTKRRVMVRRTVAVSVLSTAVVLVLSVFFSPLLGVRSVDVSGTQALTVADVVGAAQVPIGTPMLRLDTASIAARVRQLPRVATVDVTREWPAGVRIAITERTPVGYVVAHDGIELVDRTGVAYADEPAAPRGLTKLLLTAASPDDERTRAVVDVVAALPPQLHALVLTVGAPTPGSVTLGLTGGRTVRWGSADDSARKAQVLAALMTQPGKVYDVSSPELPTIS